VSGFLVNLPRRHIRLVTPVPSSDDLPDGFRVLGESSFTDAPSFGAALHSLANRHMIQGLGRGDVLRLRPEVICETVEDGFVLTYGKVRHTVSGGVAGRLRRTLLARNQTVGDACADFGTGLRELFDMSRTIEALFDAGVLLEPDECTRASVADTSLAAA
jgi:hypothetical protein